MTIMERYVIKKQEYVLLLHKEAINSIYYHVF
jgi:hypothetical protein